MKLKVDHLYKWFLCAAMIFAAQWAIAQRTITGIVTDEKGEALIGANILVIGTSAGAITDLDGTYSLSVPTSASELEFSYTGYASQRIAIGNQTVVNVQLAQGTALDELVVVGYGSVKKSDATGALTSISEKDFNRGVIASPEELIQGRAAGVQITTASGEPGAGVNIRIRGTSSVRSGNNPLFVVDGVPLTGDDTGAGGADPGIGRSSARNPLNFLNPNDIATMDVLKDASATAIYGSRGANGVVIITTKSGQAGKGSLDYSLNVGTSSVANRYDLLGADEFLKAYESFNGSAAAAQLDGGADTDWQDVIFRTGLTQSHNLSYGSGNDKGSFRFSLSYFDQEGVVLNSDLKRVSGRFNGSRKFMNDRLTISSQLTIANTRDGNVPISENSGFRGDLIGNVLKANPTISPYLSDGSLNQKDFSETEPSPLAFIELYRSSTNTLRALGNMSGEFKITDNLSFKSVLGLDRSSSARRDAYSRDMLYAGITGKGRLYTGDIDINNTLWENYFTYQKDFGAINFTGLLGYSYQSFNNRSKAFEMRGFRTSDLNLMINNIESLEVENSNGVLQNAIVPIGSGATFDELQSYFGRINFDLVDKYLFTFTLRADGSTRFGSGNKYGYFPSAAFKWRLIEEAFVPDAFSDLGLRLGYGVTGNQEIPHNVYSQRQRFNGWDIVEGGDIDGGGLGTVAFDNPDLKWESTSQVNLGIDFGFIDNRLSGSIDLYRKNTNDLLFQVRSAQPAPNPFVWKNLDADVVNSGIELGLNYVAVDNDKLRWDVNGNIAYNKNIVENFGGLVNTGEINGQGLTGAFAQRIAEGQPLFSYFLREFGGFDSEGITIYEGGDFQKFVGNSPLPSVNAGLTNSFRFGDIDFNFFLNGQFGHWIYSNTANAYFTAGALANGRNVTKDVVGNGESNLNAPDVSTRFLERGDFVRLQNASLGYNLPIKGSEYIKSVRFSVTGQNLAVFTNYSGQDPEVNVNKAIDGVPSFGIDYTTYPRARTIVFGANVSF